MVATSAKAVTTLSLPLISRSLVKALPVYDVFRHLIEQEDWQQRAIP